MEESRGESRQCVSFSQGWSRVEEEGASPRARPGGQNRKSLKYGPGEGDGGAPIQESHNDLNISG